MSPGYIEAQGVNLHPTWGVDDSSHLARVQLWLALCGHIGVAHTPLSAFLVHSSTNLQSPSEGGRTLKQEVLYVIFWQQRFSFKVGEGFDLTFI